MRSPSGRYVIAFNGEVYNFIELRRALEQRGFTFRGRSDTEVMLAAFEHWGFAEALSQLVGMFAFALWDTHDQQLYLVRDRLGEKPLYYGWQQQSFVFGSELNALRLCCDWSGEIDRQALPLLLRYGYVPAPYSIYRNIFKLMPGTYLTLGCAEPHRETQHVYWSAKHCFQAGSQRPLDASADEVVDELETLLTNSIRGQMISDVELGAFLSGGVDSSTVVALMQKLSSRPVKTFSIGFDVPEYNEAEYARQVANHLRTDHTELYVTSQQAQAVIPLLAGIYDEPFGDSSQIPTVLLAQMARQHVKVSLSGDGGDELFCGYECYRETVAHWTAVRSSVGPLRRAIATVARRVPEPLIEAALYPIVRTFTKKPTGGLGERFYSRMKCWQSKSLEALYWRSTSYWMEPKRTVLNASEPVTLLNNPDAFLRCNDDYQKLMYLDAVTYLPDDILVKVDRAAMAVSLETRIPLLDHRVVEFAARIPAGLRMLDGSGKWPLRQVLYRYVPRELIDRQKRGFAVPIAKWLRGPLRSWASDLLQSQRLNEQGWFNVKSVERKWREHQAGDRRLVSLSMDRIDVSDLVQRTGIESW